MKKITILLTSMIFLITLVGCFSQETTITFTKLPNSVYQLDTDFNENDLENFLEDIEISISDYNGGKPISLKDAKVRKLISIFDADLSKPGLHTLLVTYGSLVLTFDYYVSAPEPVDPDYSWEVYGKGDSSENPYEIGSAAQLLGLAKRVNSSTSQEDPLHYMGKFFKLTEDIDLTGVIWTPIGEGTREKQEDSDDYVSFKGTFDGDGHIITGLSDLGYVPKVAKDYVTPGGTFVSKGYVFGLFGRVNGATIKNLIMDKVDIRGIVSIDTLTGQYISYNGDSVGAIAGFGAGSGDITIENCKAYGNIKGYDAVAGIFGRAYQTGELTIKKCEADMQIVQTRYTEDQGKAAIIVGAVSGPSYFSIEECIARGSIDAGYNGGAGGIIGFLGSINGSFKKSHNYATFSSKLDSENASGWNLPDRDKLQGGMFGFASNTSLNITFDECTSTGSVLFGEYEKAVDIGNGFGQLIANIKSDTNENGTIILINGSQYNPIA